MLILSFLFQLERSFYAVDLVAEGFVNFQSLLYCCTAVDDGGMVALANEQADT